MSTWIKFNVIALVGYNTSFTFSMSKNKVFYFLFSISCETKSTGLVMITLKKYGKNLTSQCSHFK